MIFYKQLTLCHQFIQFRIKVLNILFLKIDGIMYINMFPYIGTAVFILLKHTNCITP